MAIAIRLDSRGPALFRQRRVGHGEREFTLLKFRSMRVDADPRGHREYVTALIQGEAPDGGRENLYKLAVDDRITPVGRWIRRWSLDELPQLFNVFAGDMTLVGPRPAIPYEVDEYPSWYRRRFSVKPGLTGLWQVSGRNERTYEEMVRLDIEYAERRSLLPRPLDPRQDPVASCSAEGTRRESRRARSAPWSSATATGARTSSATSSSDPSSA